MTFNYVAYIRHARVRNFYGIFIENSVVLMLYWEVYRQNIPKFTTNICFHALTVRWVEPYDFPPWILLSWLTSSSHERDELYPLCFIVSP